MMLRSRPVIWRIGSTPSSMSSAEQATGESLTVAAWLSVTLTASTDPASARAPARTSSGSGSRGGPSSAVTTKLRDDSAEASIARLRRELVGEGRDGHLEAAALGPFPQNALHHGDDLILRERMSGRRPRPRTR